MDYCVISKCPYCGLENHTTIETTPYLGTRNGCEIVTCFLEDDASEDYYKRNAAYTEKGGCECKYVIEWAVTVSVDCTAHRIEGIAERLAEKQKQAAHGGDQS